MWMRINNFVLNENVFFYVSQMPKFLIRLTTTSTDGCPYLLEVTYRRDIGLRCTLANGTNDPTGRSN